MEKFRRFNEQLSYGAGYAAGLVLLAIIGLTMVEVFSRYVLERPLILSDEFGGYALIAISFLGLSFCARDQSHIRITFLVGKFPSSISSPVRVVTLALGLLFVVAAAWVNWQFLADSFARDMRSNSLLMVPLKWPQMAMPVGLTLFALLVLARLIQGIRDLFAGRVVDEFSNEEF